MGHKRRRPFRQYDRILTQFIRSSAPAPAVQMYLHHPNGAFPRAFNTHTRGVDDRGIDRVYANLVRVLERFVRDRDIADGDHLHRVAVGVLNRLGRHHRLLSVRRATLLNPAATGGGPDGQLTGRVSGVDVEQVAVVTADPADGVLAADARAALLRGARAVGRLYVRVAHVYGRFAYEAGTTYGAYVHIARRAVLDEAGRVVDVRPWRVAVPTAGRPDPRVVCQVRTLHLEALSRIADVGRGMGFEPLPRA